MYAPVDIHGQAGGVVDFPIEIYEIISLFVRLAGCLDPEYGGGTSLAYT